MSEKNSTLKLFGNLLFILRIILTPIRLRSIFLLIMDTEMEMKAAMLREPQSLKQKMLYAFENDEDHDRLLALINSMEDS